MSTEYIVKFSKNTNNCLYPSDKVDGFVELTPSGNNSRIPTISVRTHKSSSDKDNISLLFKFITSNFAKVDFNDSDKTCSLSYNDGYSRSLSYSSLIEFDDSSSSAYSEFKKTFEDLLNSKYETEYYNSGNVKYTGNIVTEDSERLYNGEGTLYYDTYFNKAKYIGEFEDGKFDGAGKFFNQDGNVTLIANNISNGIPVQKGKLHINFRNRQEMIDITFSELWIKLDVDDKISQRQLVKSDEFVNMVTSSYLNKTDKSINLLMFEDKSPSEQNIELWNNLQKARREINTIRNDINTNMNNIVSVTKTLTSFVIFNLLLNFVVIYLK